MRRVRPAAVALVLLSACSGKPAAHKEALILIEDSNLRCESILSQVLTLWEAGGSSPERLLGDFYEGSGHIDLDPLEVRLSQSRDALATFANQSGQQKDLLFELYTGVDKLCGLAKSPYGYSRLTYNERRSALRDEIAGAKSKLNILLSVTDSERAAVLAKYSAPVQEAARRAKWEFSGAKALVAAQHQQEEAESAARRAAERKRFDDAEATRAEGRNEGEGSETARRPQQEEVPQSEEAEQRGQEERRDYLTSTSASAKAWFEQSYPSINHFCSTAARFAADLQTSRFARFQECGALKDSVSLLRSNVASGPSEISNLFTGILDSYETGAAACLRKNELVSVGSFNRGQRDCAQLKYHLREYGFSTN